MASKSKRAQLAIDDPEPLWTLKGRDILAPNAIRRWAQSAAELGVPAHKIGTAMLDAAEIERWQRRNGCKIPD